MLLGSVVSISITVFPNNISAVIRTLNTATIEGNPTGQNVPHFQVGEEPKKVAIDASDDIVYVANQLSDTVSIIDTNTMEAPKNIPVGDDPGDIEVDEDKNIAYVANFGSDTVSIIDTNTMKVSNIPVEDGPVNIEVDEDENLAYVANQLSDTVSVIDTNTMEVSNVTVAVADELSRSEYEVKPVVKPVDMELAYLPFRLYVVKEYSDSVSKFFPEGFAASGDYILEPALEILVGDVPVDIEVDEKHNIAYVANQLSGTVSIIDTNPVEENVSHMPVGASPQSIVC